MKSQHSRKLNDTTDVNAPGPVPGLRLLPRDSDGAALSRKNDLRSKELVRRVRSHDRSALGALHDMHARDVREHVAERIEDRLLREDVCQEVWAAVLEEIDGYEESRTLFKTWLLAIAERSCRKLEVQRERERDNVSLDSVASEPAARDAADVAERAELARDVASALESVTKQEREAFFLKHEEVLSYDEIAVRLGVTEEAAESLVLRCTGRLRGLLAKHDPRRS